VWRYEELGLGVKVTNELMLDEDVVDLLMSMLYSAWYPALRFIYLFILLREHAFALTVVVSMAALRRGRASSATRSPTTLSVRVPRDMTKWCVNAGLLASHWWKRVTSPGGDVDLSWRACPQQNCINCLDGIHELAAFKNDERALRGFLDGKVRTFHRQRLHHPSLSRAHTLCRWDTTGPASVPTHSLGAVLQPRLYQEDRSRPGADLAHTAHRTPHAHFLASPCLHHVCFHSICLQCKHRTSTSC
jgi:hypothetical protein